MLRTALLLSLALVACAEPSHDATDSAPIVSTDSTPPESAPMPEDPMPEDASADAAESEDATPVADAAPKTELATFGAGCYWCVEAVLEQLDGVLDVTSGFMGGHVDNPSYRAVCSGTTGHAEVVQATFDPEVISYDALLAWFWKLHDPTTLNRQGADVGTQYRSAIFYHSDAQREAAERSMAAAQSDFLNPIVTEITAASTYYVAKEDHQDYYRNNRQQGYCRAVIAPKLDKLGLDK